jgi:hypothetical protein
MLCLCVGAAIALPLCSQVSAQPVPDYGFEWRVVGDPGNRATLPEETPAIPDVPLGSVPYEFRITRTKLSNADYLEFVRAYAPYWTGDPDDPDLTGFWIRGIQRPDGTWEHRIAPGSEQYGARITWEMSARYVTWLHNGRASEQWAFESGAYDTSTFYRDPQGRPQHQVNHSPEALFWIPTLDEWAKAAYWDPNRDGPGLGGYWRYPDSGNDPMIEGLPEEGGETIGDDLWDMDPRRELGRWPLGQYPDAQSPWGLIDISCTVPDYTSTLILSSTFLPASSAQIRARAVPTSTAIQRSTRRTSSTSWTASSTGVE